MGGWRFPASVPRRLEQVLQMAQERKKMTWGRTNIGSLQRLLGLYKWLPQSKILPPGTYALSIEKEKEFTRQQLNNLDKDMQITLLLSMQDQLMQQTAAIEKPSQAVHWWIQSLYCQRVKAPDRWRVSTFFVEILWSWKSGMEADSNGGRHWYGNRSCA